MPIFGKEVNSHFTYSATEQAPPFPLDYTTGELKKKWGVTKDMPVTRMFKHKQFRDFFLWLQYDDKTLKEMTESSECNEAQTSEKDSSKYKPYNGLPPELEPFMRLYMKAYDIENPGNSSVKFAQFIPDFCAFLHGLSMDAELEAECTPNVTESDSGKGGTDGSREVSAPDDRYWYRLLYKNEGFQEAIIRSYWQKEYDSRTKTAKELFQKMPYDFQIQALQQNICYLDTQIAAMLQTIEQNKQSIPVPDQTSLFLKTFPTELMQELRKKVPSKNDQGRATFRVKNFMIHKHDVSPDRDLLSYLKDITGNQNPETVKKEIRPYYLQEICQVPDAPPFLTACLKLQKYLDSSTGNDIQSEDVVNYVYNKSRELYQAALRFDPFPATTSTNFRNDHIGSMLDQLIYNMYNNFMVNYGQEFDYLRYWLNFRPSEQSISHLSPTIIPDQADASKAFMDIYNFFLDMVYTISGKTLKNPGISWDNYRYVLIKLVGTDIYSDYWVLSEPLTDAAIKNLSAHLAKTCREAYNLLKLEAPEWISEATFQTAWQHYSQALVKNAQSKNDSPPADISTKSDGTNAESNAADTATPAILISTENYYLLAALMIQRISHAYHTNCEAAISAYQHYTSFVKGQK